MVGAISGAIMNTKKFVVRVMMATACKTMADPVKVCDLLYISPALLKCVGSHNTFKKADR